MGTRKCFNETPETIGGYRCGSSLAGTALVFAQTPAAAKPRMADDVFKNIQVMKGITVDEFMGAMGLFSAALNVCCGDCHVGAGGSDPKWADDVRPARRSRGTWSPS